MCPDIVCLGELLVEIMRAEVGVPHGVPGLYRGPYPSGAPAIFIDSAARMGSPHGLTTGFVGVVGDDDFGRVITGKLERDGVDTSRVRVDPERTTGVAFVQYNEDGSRKFIFAAGAAGQTTPADLDPPYFEGVRALHLMGSALAISQTSRDACYEAIRLARAANPSVVVSFDPNLRSEMAPLEEIERMCRPVLEEADIILPSGEEAALLTGETGEVAACEALLRGKARVVVLKQAAAGCTVFSAEHSRGLHVPGFDVEEVDPTGAGDSFGGAFVVAFLLDWDLERAARFANAVGALKVTSYGPMPDTTLEEAKALAFK
ncbi:MAG: sugar kinase [Promethearchaeota archaeon]